MKINNIKLTYLFCFVPLLPKYSTAGWKVALLCQILSKNIRRDRLYLAKYRRERKGKGEKVIANLSIINFGSCDT